jgi:hypothetical protein
LAVSVTRRVKTRGKRAYAQALAVPQTAGTPIYFCVDEGYDPTKPKYAGPIEAYFKGVNDAFAEAAGQAQQPVYKIGVYGPGAVCKWLKQKGMVTYTWLAMSTAWPGYNYSDWNIKQARGYDHLGFDNDRDDSNLDAGFWRLAAANPPQVAHAGATGAQLLALARQHIGEPYENVPVPKNNLNWHGPWDCSEFMSWIVYRIAGVLYGCTNDHDNPAVAHGFTGAWGDDSLRLGIRVPIERAAGIPGAMVLRLPPAPRVMGHIAMCDGRGGTVEAKGHQFGVVADQVAGRRWDTGVLVPGVTYDNPAPVPVPPPQVVYYVGATDLDPAVVRNIQTKLAANRFDPGPVDGEYGLNTAMAVAAFQVVNGLVADGEVGLQTAAALGVTLT